MDLSQFKKHLLERGVPHASPEAPDFNSLFESVTGIHQERQPSIIVRPRDAEDVSDVVKYCAQYGESVTVRSGGHDMFGRYAAPGVVNVDVRDLQHVKVSEDKQTAKIGGGATAIQILEKLKPEGLQIPTGGCGSISYAGWSTLGGIGPHTHSYGFGTDSILGAKLVNAQGQIVQANNEVLKGLRGGGGNFGIIVELTIKVFSMTEVQAGVILYESSNVRKTVTDFLTNYTKLVSRHGKLPSELAVEPGIWSIPGLGTVLTTVFIWKGPITEVYEAWLKDIEGLTPLMDPIPGFDVSVKSTSIFGYVTMCQEVLVPKSARVHCETVSLRGYSAQVIEALAEAAENLPKDSAAGLNVHVIRDEGPSFSADVPESMCPCREPQIVLEILGYAGNGPESVSKASDWAVKTRERFCELDDALETSYLPLTAPNVLDLKRIYGEEKLRELRALKSKYDPDGIFRYAIPRLEA